MPPTTVAPPPLAVPATPSPSQQLFDAIGEGNTALVQDILGAGPDPLPLLRRNDLQGLSPLRKAIALGRADIARVLVHHGAEPSVRDPLGRIPLHMAATQGSRLLVAPLLVSQDSSVNTQDKYGWTPLHYAVRGKHLKVIDWLLFAGADINLRNQNEERPIDMCEKGSDVHSLLVSSETVDREENPVVLSSAYIGKKQLSNIGPDGSVLFVTSESWSDDAQFIFNVRIRPANARPRIPLRVNETFYSDVNKYRMMRKLAEGRTRVKAYFSVFEEIHNSELIVKVTSKSKYLGEVPTVMSQYRSQNYTNYLACADLDMKDGGQFVLVKRPRVLLLRKDAEELYSCKQIPMVKINVPDGALPGAPEGWDEGRRDRALAETADLVSKLKTELSTTRQTFLEEDDSTEDVPRTEDKPADLPENLPEDQTENNRYNKSPNKSDNRRELSETNTTGNNMADHYDVPGNNQNMNAEISPENDPAEEKEKAEPAEGDDGAGEDGEGEHNDEEEEEEEVVCHGYLLEGDEEDDCEDFYYISRGWGLTLEVRVQPDHELLLGKAMASASTILCCSPFFRLSHSSGAKARAMCTLQIPKADTFAKVGTVLVFVRTEPTPQLADVPDPDDSCEENYLSEDGKTTMDKWWLAQEQERWRLLPRGIVNRDRRVIFQTNQIATYIVVQLDHGTEVAESEVLGQAVSESDTGDSETGPTEDNLVEDDDDDEEQRAVDDEEEDARRKKRKKRREKSLVSSSQHDGISEKVEEVKQRGGETQEDHGEMDRGKQRSKHENLTSSPAPGPAIASAEEAEKPEAAPTEGQPDATPLKPTAEPDAPAPSPQTSTAVFKPVDDPLPEQDQNASNWAGMDKVESDSDSDDNTKDANNSSAASRRKETKNNNANEEEDVAEEVEVTSEASTESYFLPEERTVCEGMQSVSGSFAGLSYDTRRESVQREPSQDESEEYVANKPREQRALSLVKDMDGQHVLEQFTYGRPLTSLDIPDHEISQLTWEIALMWRYRNHRETVVLAFTKPRPGHDCTFDFILEVVKLKDIAVRAEHQWTEGYRMVGRSLPFATKSCRLFSFAMEGTMVVEDPPGSSPGSIQTRTIFYYASKINCLHYVVRRVHVHEEAKGPGGKKPVRKKEEAKAEIEADAHLEVTAFLQNMQTQSLDIATMQIFLTGPDLWHERHIEMRSQDDVFLQRLAQSLRRDKMFRDNWWKVWLCLGYPEKDVEMEKVKTDWAQVAANMVQKWFTDNLDAYDRGIVHLLYCMDWVELDTAIDLLLSELATYKFEISKTEVQPRYLKLFFHWLLSNKISRNSILRQMEPQILKPVSDIFLLATASLIKEVDVCLMGPLMDLEENIVHAIQCEENILDPVYKVFRVLVKSRQKKDEIVHYTLLLMELVKQLDELDALDFVVHKTKKWMSTVAETEPDLCAKLDNVFLNYN